MTSSSASVVSPAVSKSSSSASSGVIVYGSVSSTSVFCGSLIGPKSVGSSSSKSFTLSSDLVVERVEILGCGAVKVEPPVADEVVLVEEGSVGTEEAVLGETAGSVSCADVEGLAFGLWVSIVTSVNLTVARKSRFGDFGVDGVVFSGHSRDAVAESSKWVVTSSFVSGHSIAGCIYRNIIRGNIARSRFLSSSTTKLTSSSSSLSLT